MNHQTLQRVIRQLAAAEGYLQLNMPMQALEQLDRVEETGPLEGISQLLRGEALSGQSRYDEAIPVLNQAAALFPAPFNQRAFLALGKCYRAIGKDELAAVAETAANPEGLPPGEIQLQLIVVPFFPVSPKQSGGSTLRWDRGSH